MGRGAARFLEARVLMPTVMQAINDIRSTLEWPKVDASDGLTHRIHRYNRRLALWVYACDTPFTEDALRTYASNSPITCVGCMGLEGRTEFVPPP